MREILGWFGSELQLINIYASLCDPAKATEWNELTVKCGLHLNFEKGIEKKFSHWGRDLEPNCRTLYIVKLILHILADRFMALHQSVLLVKVWPRVALDRLGMIQI
ncbi:unnamed protein product [Rhizophagus irregularis]|nr:unnamed protein product [Rhizophagus irregularis]CAB4403780.1 unnamed protein product [Rhizophagus irregularis]